MKLIMHDLTESDFKKIAPSTHPDTTVIFDNGKIHACVGCFGCWIKTPGVCVMNDGYQNLGQMFSKSDEIIVISRCIYGTYSPFIKNIWDRSISYMLPYFTKINNETHHKMRYDNNFKLIVHFYGDDLTRNEIDTARKFVNANCVNFVTVPEISFHETFEEIGVRKCESLRHTQPCAISTEGRNNRTAVDALGSNGATTSMIRNISLNVCAAGGGMEPSMNIALINGSPKLRETNNSKILLDFVKMDISSGNKLSEYNINKGPLTDKQIAELCGMDIILIAFPLYCDALPSHLLKMAVQIEEYIKRNNAESHNLYVYVMANNGFYEGEQNKVALDIIKNWCDRAGFVYGQGIGQGGGEMLAGVKDVHLGHGPLKNLGKALDVFTENLRNKKRGDNIFLNPSFPNILWRVMAEKIFWNRAAKKRGLKKKDIVRRPII